MKENKDENYGLELVFLITVALYFISVVTCCLTLIGTISEDLSFEELKILSWLNVGCFLSLAVPSMIYLVTLPIIAIRNKIKHYVDVFHYYEKLKSDEDKKHLLYNNKSKTKL